MDKRTSTTGPACLLLAMTVLGGCAGTPDPARIAIAAPVAAPQPPAGASVDLVTPEKDPAGRYRTPNLDISPAATVWHVRSALNVAALGCRGPAEATLIADYNSLLAGKRSILAAAFARTESEARASVGKQWRDAHDRQMTRVYNFFAQPPAKTAFCAIAVEVAAQAAATPPASFQAFAEAALPRLEAPFLDFYARYDAYRTQLAAWRADAASATRLTYAPMDGVIAWAPEPVDPDRRLAAAGPARR